VAGDPGEPRTFTASDGYEFAWTRYAPEGEARGRVVAVHGIRSHAGWYTRSCARLAAAGYEVNFLDRRGAGRNTLQRGDCAGFRQLRRDVIEFLAAHPSAAPTHLMGISWGGKLAAAVAAEVPVASLVLVAPGFVPARPTPPGTFLSIACARFVNPTTLFDVPLNTADLFTANPDWQAFLRANPHDTHRATARFFVGSAALDFRLRRTTIATPTLLLLAGDDRVIDNARTRAYFAAHFPNPANRTTEYPGRRHTLEFEDAGLTFVDDILKWLADYSVPVEKVSA
jgi:alpha-beta hydrolase superfamily lysophospholipase